MSDKPFEFPEKKMISDIRLPEPRLKKIRSEGDVSYDEWRRRVRKLIDEEIKQNIVGIKKADVSNWAKAITDEAKERGIPWEPEVSKEGEQDAESHSRQSDRVDEETSVQDAFRGDS